MGMSFTLSEWRPSGITMIEASAGTGKTFTLASICVRGFAEGWLEPSNLCAMTFSDKAASELKDRIRAQVDGVLSAFSAVDKGVPIDTSKPHHSVFMALWDSVGPEERKRRADNLAEALREFDGVSVSTIHGFCQRVLASIGHDLPTDLITRDIDEVITDVVLARYTHPDQLPLEIKKLNEAVTTRLASPDLTLWPPHDDIDDLIDTVCAEVRTRRDSLGYRTFDDLLIATRDAVVTSSRGPGIVADLRQRFRLVLIDEFQDTDRVQWELFREAFANPDRGPVVPVVLVGDPKQSIYRFRGAELSSYLDARAYTESHGGVIYELTTNYRSSPRYLTALDDLFAGFEFGAGATFVPVTSSQPDDPEPSGPPKLQFRLIDEDMAGPIAQAANTDLLTLVLDLLNPPEDNPAHTDRPHKPSDIAILTRSNNDADEVMDLLRRAGLPASASTEDSVLESRAAREWLTLLHALSNPSSVSWARTVSVGWFGSSNLNELATFTDDDDLVALERCTTWATALTSGGLPRLLTALNANGLRERLLKRVGGERDLTDLEHIAELMQHHTAGHPTQPEHLIALLEDLAHRNEGRTTTDLLERRVDRDDDTVKVMTVHKAKGLEFSVVLCVGFWRGTTRYAEVRHAFLPERGERVIDAERLAGSPPSSTALHPLAAEEESDEATRLAYVALTRAKERAVIWWAPTYSRRDRSVQRILTNANGEDFEPWRTEPDSSIGAVVVNPPAMTTRRWIPLDAPFEPLDLATFTRTFDPVWGSWSFSRILRLGTEHRHGPALPSRTEETDHPAAGGADEIPATSEDPAPTPTDRPPSETGVLQTAPGGVAFGLLVHSILEQSDFTSSDLAGELLTTSEHHLRHHAGEINPHELAHGLQQAIERPLGGPLGSFRLADLAPSDRLNELWFHLPAPRIAAKDVAATIADHLSEHDPLRPWFAAAAAGALRVEIEGLLNGSIDLVGRTGDRFWLADYKTNRIGNHATFSESEMVGEMAHHGYPLQAALYLLALHRFLRLRLAHYEPSRHLNGAAYLFIRGMADSAANRGVFWWNPPVAMLDALDHLFSEPKGLR